MKATAHITESWGFVVVIFFDSVGSCVYYYNNQTTQAPQLVDEQHSAKYADNSFSLQHFLHQHCG